MKILLPIMSSISPFGVVFLTLSGLVVIFTVISWLLEKDPAKETPDSTNKEKETPDSTNKEKETPDSTNEEKETPDSTNEEKETPVLSNRPEYQVSGWILWYYFLGGCHFFAAVIFFSKKEYYEAFGLVCFGFLCFLFCHLMRTQEKTEFNMQQTESNTRQSELNTRITAVESKKQTELLKELLRRSESE